MPTSPTAPASTPTTTTGAPTPAADDLPAAVGDIVVDDDGDSAPVPFPDPDSDGDDPDEIEPRNVPTSGPDDKG